MSVWDAKGSGRFDCFHFVNPPGGPLTQPNPTLPVLLFLQDYEFRCHGGLVGCPSTQSVELSTSVSFLDATLPALDMYKEFPILEAKLPHDFFYPFINDEWRKGDSEQNRPASSSGSGPRPTWALMVFVPIFLYR